MERFIIYYIISIAIVLFVVRRQDYNEYAGDLFIYVLLAPILAPFMVMITLMNLQIKKGKNGDRPPSY